MLEDSDFFLRVLNGFEMIQLSEWVHFSAQVIMWSLYIVRWLTCQDSAKCCCVIHDDYKSFFSQSVQQHLAQIIILMILRDNTGVASSGCFLLIRESLIPPTPDTPVIPRYLATEYWSLAGAGGWSPAHQCDTQWPSHVHCPRWTLQTVTHCLDGPVIKHHHQGHLDSV